MSKKELEWLRQLGFKNECNNYQVKNRETKKWKFEKQCMKMQRIQMKKKLNQFYEQQMVIKINKYGRKIIFK